MPRERTEDPTRDWTRPTCECLRVFCRDMYQLWPTMGTEALTAVVLGGQVGIIPFGSHQNDRDYRPQNWVASGKTSNREGAELHPSADNRIKYLLSMALFTKARSSFPHSQSLPWRSLHKPLILIHQRADRRNKNHNHPVSGTKNTIIES